MSNQTAATIGAIANAVNWEKEGLDLQSIIEAANQGRLGGPLTSWLVAREWNRVNAYLQKLFEMEIGVVNGKDTYETTRKVFPAGFDSDFENWGVVFSGVASKTRIEASKLVQNGKFSDFLGNTVAELEKRRMLGSQFLAICRDPNKLQDGGYANFFVLTKGDEKVAEDLSNVFVARVLVSDDGRLGADLDEFRYDYVCLGDHEHRVFYPQQ